MQEWFLFASVHSIQSTLALRNFIIQLYTNPYKYFRAITRIWIRRVFFSSWGLFVTGFQSSVTRIITVCKVQWLGGGGWVRCLNSYSLVLAYEELPFQSSAACQLSIVSSVNSLVFLSAICDRVRLSSPNSFVCVNIEYNFLHTASFGGWNNARVSMESQLLPPFPFSPIDVHLSSISGCC